ncbi:MAG: sugar ABC transporter permease [Candidatus Dormibacteraeota bacterium]|nr:sugar ABC transporter permease [Candidatus Dormibacteraeota bacterium]
MLTMKGVPIVRGVATSLTTPQGVLSSRFVGLANYQRMLHDEVWLASLRNAGKLVLTLPVFILVPLVFAAVLFNGAPGWRFFRATFFMSWLLPPVSVGFMFTPIFGSYGPINMMLSRLNVEPIPWLGSPTLAPLVVGAALLWSWFGLGTVIYLAGLATIPTDQLDASRIDGARMWSVLRWVQIPHLVPTIAFWSVLCTSNMLLNVFAYIYALTEGGPGTATMLPEYYIWTTTQYFNPGYTSALGISLFIIVAAVVFIQVRFLLAGASDE